MLSLILSLKLGDNERLILGLNEGDNEEEIEGDKLGLKLWLGETEELILSLNEGLKLGEILKLIEGDKDGDKLIDKEELILGEID